MKQILLTQRKVALVDDSDYEWLNRFKWYALKGGHTFYAIHRGKSMHRLILGLKLGDKRKCDHIDRNGLNNQRSNLRLCNSAENPRHSRLNCRNTVGFKGVYMDKRATPNRYIARIGVNYKHLYLGCYPTPLAAARAYDAAATEHHRQFALTNKMLGLL